MFINECNLIEILILLVIVWIDYMIWVFCVWKKDWLFCDYFIECILLKL